MVFDIKKIVLGVGIFIVYLLMLNYGIEAFYPSPKYEDFCKGGDFGRYPTKVYDMEVQNCSFSRALQEQQDACYADGGNPVFEYDNNGCSVGLKECNYCNKEFNEADKEYSKVVFIIAIISGIITLILGYAVLSVEPVGSALMASGVGAIFYGSVRNWQNLSDIWRFLLLLVSLVLLIWIALRLNKLVKNQNKKGFFYKLKLLYNLFEN